MCSVCVQAINYVCASTNWERKAHCFSLLIDTHLINLHFFLYKMKIVFLPSKIIPWIKQNNMKLSIQCMVIRKLSFLLLSKCSWFSRQNIFLMFFFFFWKRERDRQRMSRGGAEGEGEGDIESKAGSRLWALSS